MANPDTERRRYQRKEIQIPVEYEYNGQTYKSKSLNISPEGIFLESDYSLNPGEEISLKLVLPNHETSLQIPSQIVRINNNTSDITPKGLYAKFAYIPEHYKKTVKDFIGLEDYLELYSSITESRQFPRKICYFKLISKSKDMIFGNIMNISPGGFHAAIKGIVTSGQTIEFKLYLPYWLKGIGANGEIHLVKKLATSDWKLINVKFTDLKNRDKKKIRDFVLNQILSDLLKEFQKIFTFLDKKNFKPLSEKKLIMNNLKRIKEQSLEFICISSKNSTPTACSLINFNQNEMHLQIFAYDGSFKINLYSPMYFTFYIDQLTFFFEGFITHIKNNRVTIHTPELMFYTERRAQDRYEYYKYPSQEIIIQNYKILNVMIHEMTAYGFSFIIEKDVFPYNAGTLLKVCREKITGSNEKIFYDNGIVKYINPHNESDHLIKVGVELCIEKQNYTFQSECFNKEEKGLFSKATNWISNFNLGLYNFYQNKFSSLKTAEESSLLEIVRYKNEKDEEIVGILNRTWEGNEKKAVPVVIIPPAFGRRKETTCSLALTILDNFKRYGKDIVILRYDGIRCIGESYNDTEFKEDELEMYNFTLSQTVQDILTTLDFVENNNIFSPTSIILISFSLTAVPARKAILLDKKKRISYWICPMGASDAQDVVRNARGGEDYFKNFITGKINETEQVLGYIVNSPRFGRDAISNGMAFLDDAREEIKNITIPICWLCGKYDYWINHERIKDIMGVKSNGYREVIEVPTGHIIKTSDEAIQVFKLITQKILKYFYIEELKSFHPNLKKLIKTSNIEIKRISKDSIIDKKRYWTTYILGNKGQKIGFDILMMSEEYPKFIKHQAELLDMKNSEFIADMGCGTGNFVELTLEDWLHGKKFCNFISFPKIVMVDFVKEALEKAKLKHKSIISTHNINNLPLEYNEIDLEDNSTLNNYFQNESFDKIFASLLVSYLHEPQKLILKFYKMLKNNGKIVISTLKADADISKIVHESIKKFELIDEQQIPYKMTKEDFLKEARSYISTTSSILNYEDKGIFHFYRKEELIYLLKKCGFKNVKIYESFGDPPQAYIGVGIK